MAMATGAFYGVPLFFRNKTSGFQAQPEIHKAFDVSNKNVMDMKASTLRNLSKVGGNFLTITDLRDKISTFRDLLDFSPCVGSASVHQLLIWTLNDLYKLYPSIKPGVSVSEIERAPMHKALKLLCDALKSLGDMWTRDEWMVNCEYDPFMKLELADLQQIAMEILEDMIKLARERLFDYMDDDEEMREDRPSLASPYFSKALSESFSDNNRYCVSPSTPTSVLSEGWKASPPRLLSLRVQAVGKLNPIDVKRLSFHMFSHAVVQNPAYKTVEKEKAELETKKAAAINKVNQENVKMDDMEKVDEVDQECEMEIDSPNSVEDFQVKKIYYSERNCNDIPATRPLPTPEASAKQETGVLLPAPSLLTLRSNVAEHIESLSQLSPTNGVQSQVLVAPSPNKVPSIPLSTLSPPPMIARTPAASPPPPMIVRASEKSQPPPPPPPMVSRTPAASPPPPPPPPPPMIARTSAASPPLPPPMALRNSAPPPLPPPMGASKGLVPPPPPHVSMAKGAAPPPPPPLMGGSRGPVGAAPPPPGLAGALRPKKAATKLKRSPQMGNLYRLLKGKVEGSSLDGKSSGRKGKIGTAAGGKQGMADALAEMTKRSAYFQQIEEDFKNYSGTIKEVKVKLSSFQTSDMSELIKFHRYLEFHLEKLTDETQVLARFEDFPGKKLEALRMAAALYSKLDTIVKTLENWQIVSPVGQLLDKAESYFNKIKVEMDALERTKDEESKRFQAQKITFDFGVLVRIKELMVDVSSHCMELALKEKREALAKANENGESKPDGKNNGPAKMLWRSFQFAFRVYTFAGGHDDRADKLTRELAQEIETDPHH